MSLFAELRRRNVFRVGAAYLVVAWLLIEVSDTVFPRLGLPEWTVTFIIALLALGFPLSLFFAWAFELTPEGVRRSEEIASPAPGESRQRRLADVMIIGSLVAVIGIMAVERAWFGGARDRGDAAVRVQAAAPVEAPAAAGATSRSIAVLAFEDLSPEGDQEYFADGIAEEILNLLAKLPELKVAGRTSAFQFKGQHHDLRRIGESLGVEAVLEGSVRKAGDRLRITAQLIGTADGFHLWSETYDRELTDVFAIQDDIARSIADALQVELLGIVAERGRPTENLEAYQLYLQGRHLILQRGAANLRAAVRHLERAVTLDPALAPAWADLAVGLALIPAYEWAVKRAPYARRALEAADRALALDPRLAMAYVARSFTFLNDAQWGLSLAEIEKAVALEPQNETAWFYHAMAHHGIGDIDVALASAERAYAIAPAAGVNAGWLAALHLGRGDYALARRYVDESIALGWGFAEVLRAHMQIESGDFAAAKDSLRNFLRIAGEPEDALDFVVDARQDPALAAQAIAGLAEQRQAGGHFSVWAGGILLHDSAGLADWLENSSSNLAPPMTFVYSLGGSATLNTPAFKGFLRRIGLVDYWREHGWREVCRPLGADDFEC